MEDELSFKIVGAAIEVHRHLGGPGLLESIYESALCQELLLKGMRVKRQLPVTVKYKDVVIRDPLYLDILVEDKVIVEVKAVEKDNPIFKTQLLTYLRLTDLKLGLIINFGKYQVRDGVHRIINGQLN